MKVIKLKQMAKTFIFLEEHGFANMEELSKAATDAEARFYELKDRIKAAEARMAEIQMLRTHILNYIKTREVYEAYRKSGYQKKFLAEHEGEIILHKASKKAFDELKMKKLPTIRSLNEEFARLLTEKKALYVEYRKAQNEMKKHKTHKANAEYVLGYDDQKTKEEVEQRE